MENQIQNSRLHPGPAGGPEHFSCYGLTYDNFTHNGYRTCSVTIPNGVAYTGLFLYEPPIGLRGAKALRWGLFLRAIEVQSASLTAAFYSAADDLLQTVRREITGRICSEFRPLLEHFNCPEGAESAHVSLEFSGRVTACTLCAPQVYLC